MTYWGMNTVLLGLNWNVKECRSLTDVNFVSQYRHLCMFCMHHRTIADTHPSLIKRKSRQKHRNINRKPWKLWQMRTVNTSCVKRFITSLSSWVQYFDLWPQFWLFVCVPENFISTRMELGWRLKPECYFKTAEKIYLHTVKPFSQKVNLRAAILKIYKYCFFSQALILSLSNILAFATPLLFPY